MAVQLLDIVTVTMNDTQGLVATYRSIMPLLENKLARWIVIDGSATPNEIFATLGRDSPDGRVQYHNGADNGIYDAMNKGAAFLNAEYCWYLNSGDVFQGKDLDDQRLLDILQRGSQQSVHGFFFGYEKSGRRHFPRSLGYAKFGMPTCHQAIIVRSDLVGTFDQQFPFAGDYKWVAELYRKRTIKIEVCDFVLCVFDDTGQSSLHYREYNKEIREIQIKHQGWIAGTFFYILRVGARNSRALRTILRVRH